MKNLLSKRILNKYSRQIILKDVGIIGQKKIFNSKILVVGAGGLGSPVIDLLVRAGVGFLGVIEDDKVDYSNLHRQTLYDYNDVGKYKSDVIKKPLNCLHRNNAAKAINYFIENDFNFSSYEIFNCSENSTSSINNDSKLKNTGLIFDSYD